MKGAKERNLNDDEVLLDNFDDCIIVKDVAIDHGSTKRFLLLYVKRKEKKNKET